MKTLYKITFAILAGMLIWSCAEDDTTPVAKLNAPPELSSTTASPVLVTAANADSDALELTWTPTDYNFKAGGVLYTVQIAQAGNNFANPYVLGTTGELAMSVTGTELNTALAAIGILPNENGAFEVRVISSLHAEVANGTSNVLSFNGTPTNFAAPAYPYFFVADGYPNYNWMDVAMIGSPLDNSIFEGYANFTEAGTFKLVSGADPSVVYGEGGGGAASTSGGDITIPAAGYYRIRLDLLSMMYEVIPAEWGLIGSATPGGWGADTDMNYDTDLKVWKLGVNLQGGGEIKFRANDDWALNYGDNGLDGSLEEGGGNIPIVDDGFYSVTLDLESTPGIYTYTLEFLGASPEDFLHLPGSHQGWDPSTAPTLLSPFNDGNYFGYQYFPAGTEFKFTDNPDWSVNWGDDGADGTLESGGSNISVADAGYYQIKVNLNSGTYTMLKTTWGLIGSATPDQWNSDQDMTYNQGTDTWSITLPLTADEIKFRANDDWTLNYGDNGPDGILEEGGANIAIASAGTYTVTLDLSDDNGYTYSVN